MLASPLSIDACYFRGWADAMVSLLFLGAGLDFAHVWFVKERMADNINVVESRRINSCYVGRCEPLVIVSEFPQMACNSFWFSRFAWSTANITITFLVDVTYCAPTMAVTGVQFGI